MSLFSAITGKKQSKGGQLLERLGGAERLEDRREAIAEFKDLTSRQPVRLVFEGGIGVLLNLLRGEDTDTHRDALETLVNLLDRDVPKEQPDAAQVAATHNCGVLLSHPEKIGVILGAAENSDMYVRYHATQLLMRLLSVAAARTQEAMLEQPATVAAVVKLLEDKREIVRNEVLLLLAQLSAHNASLQTILAFQGAFDQLIKIIEGELQSGESGAAAVVNDCFAIVSSLLSSSAAARRLFREEGFLPRVLPMLRLPPAHSREHARTARLACALLALLVKGMDADAAEAQEAAAGSGVVADVVALLTDPATATDPALRVQALATLAALVRGRQSACAELAAARATRKGGIDEPVLPRLLLVALRSAAAPLHHSTGSLLVGYCHLNPSAQLALAAAADEPVEQAAAAAAAAAKDGSAPPIASMCVHSLLACAEGSSYEAAGGAQAWLAACSARSLRRMARRRRSCARPTRSPRCLLAGGAAGAAASSTAGGVAAGGGLLARCARALLAALSRPATSPPPALLLLSLLLLLLVWVWDSADAAAELVAPTAALPTLVDALAATPADYDKGDSRLDPHVRGHLAALLGACLLLAPDSIDAPASPSPTRPNHGGGDASSVGPIPPGTSAEERSALGMAALMAEGKGDGARAAAAPAAAAPARVERAVVLQMIASRVGLLRLTEAWHAMLHSDAYSAAEWTGGADATAALEGSSTHGVLLYDEAARHLLGKCHERTREAVLRGYAQPRLLAAAVSEALGTSANGNAADGPPDAVMESFKQIIKSQDEEIQRLRGGGAVAAPAARRRRRRRPMARRSRRRRRRRRTRAAAEAEEEAPKAMRAEAAARAGRRRCSRS